MNGFRDFVFWYLPQIQYKNPNVQISTLKNMTPTPFIRCFYGKYTTTWSSKFIWISQIKKITESGEQMLIDVDSRSKEEIHDHLIKVIGKTDDVLRAEAIAKEKKDNPANFGVLCDRHCICEIPGQVPCPGTCPLPKHMRGKYIFAKDDN